MEIRIETPLGGAPRVVLVKDNGDRLDPLRYIKEMENTNTSLRQRLEKPITPDTVNAALMSAQTVVQILFPSPTAETQQNPTSNRGWQESRKAAIALATTKILNGESPIPAATSQPTETK